MERVFGDRMSFLASTNFDRLGEEMLEIWKPLQWYLNFYLPTVVWISIQLESCCRLFLMYKKIIFNIYKNYTIKKIKDLYKNRNNPFTWRFCIFLVKKFEQNYKLWGKNCIYLRSSACALNPPMRINSQTYSLTPDPPLFQILTNEWRVSSWKNIINGENEITRLHSHEATFFRMVTTIPVHS